MYVIDEAIVGAHLLPNSISMSCGSLFAGWMMHRTGKYKMINLIFGIFPFVAAVSISLLREDSNWFQMWFSIVSRHHKLGKTYLTPFFIIRYHSVLATLWCSK